MSTRVQKGGAVFKPVAKPRHRLSSTPSRQTSTPAPDNRSSITPSVNRDVTTPAPTQPSMPPPSVIPSRSVSTRPQPVEQSGSHRGTPVTPRPASKVIPSFTSTHHTQRTPSSPSVLLHTPTALQASTPRPCTTPGPSPPSIIVVKSGSIPPKVSLTPSGTLQDVPAASQAPATVPNAMSTVSHPAFQFPMTESISQIHKTETPLPRRTVDPENVVKPPPRRNPGRKKRGALKIGNSVSSSTAESTNENPASATPVTKGKPRRSTAAELDASEGVMESPKKRQRKASNGPRKPRKPRISSVPSYDPNADPGEEIDPTAVTMATLCKDMGQGRVSSKAVQIQSNHAAWKASNREKRAKMKSLMESKKYGMIEGDISPRAAIAGTTETAAETPAEPGLSETPMAPLAPSSTPHDNEPADKSGHGFDYSQAVSTSRYNVQVRIGPNGETVIDEESLFVDRNEDEGTENYTHVEESDTTKFVNSGTYGKKFRGSRWSAEETELFFDALSQFGENYELISYILPGRDRTSCKNKFKAEDRKNPNRITYCLNNRRPYDMQTLSRMTGKDFSGPTPEIRAPTPLTLAEKADAPNPEASTTDIRKKSRTPHLNSGGEEIVGAVADFDEDKED